MVTISLLPVSGDYTRDVMAGTTLVIIPIIILYLILEVQKAGMMEGAVKGWYHLKRDIYKAHI